ncbi:hypothetical protein Ahy_A03g011698 isoform A [Arachis hypogaea]|uniref:Uncharacterized protein n=1 Tax=Arachis hypogaea TaxID=3818 RepID=A0A445DRH6_ARAHY|nr:hypothetical protein Ahy_A03g011698 isoform A [Arachis hypogaea]
MEVLPPHRWLPGNTAIDAGKCHYWSHCPCSAPVSAAVYAGSLPLPPRPIMAVNVTAEDILAGSRLGNKFRGLFESQVLRSSSTNKERANNVVKIKVVSNFSNTKFCL